ncbi:type II secretion system F family protein [Luteipulveratus mongoliensis]|uniref:type II secretion system F family protein n=1 Tax=Luteipulveratus mongoliensis TaxID=571913 RepID=UPI0006976D10|nr:type II secretion system F family protein [Luteipulveratus mongoliensis]
MSSLLIGALVLAAWCAWPRRGVLTLAPATSAVVSAASPSSSAQSSGEGPLAVAESMDLLALALSSGAPVMTAVDAVADRSGPMVTSHLRHVGAALRWGVDPTAAWQGLPTIWQPAAQAMSLASIAGVPPAQLLKQAAYDVRDSERRRLEESAARLSVRIVIPLGLCFLPAFGLLTVVPVVAALAADLMAGVP